MCAIFAHKLEDPIEVVRFIQLVVYLTRGVPIFQWPFSDRIIMKTSEDISFRAPWFMKPD